MGFPAQVRNAAIGIILSGAEVSQVPPNARPLPSIEAMTANVQTPQINAVIEASQRELQGKIRKQPIKNQFKGGPKKLGKPRLSIIGADHAGFVFAEIAALCDIVGDICASISEDHCGYIIYAKWEDLEIEQMLQEALRQGETTQAALERTMNEAGECCKHVAKASEITVKTMMETVKNFTYKADDNAPRVTQKKRTRL